MLFLVHGDTGPVADLFASAGQRVEHRRFAGVGVAGECNSHFISSSDYVHPADSRFVGSYVKLAISNC